MATSAARASNLITILLFCSNLELLLHYQIDNTTDTPGLLILKIAAIFSEASSQDLENLYQYLLPSMDYFAIADEKRNGDVLLTNALLYEAPEEKEKQKNNDQDYTYKIK